MSCIASRLVEIFKKSMYGIIGLFLSSQVLLHREAEERRCRGTGLLLSEVEVPGGGLGGRPRPRGALSGVGDGALQVCLAERIKDTQ